MDLMALTTNEVNPRYITESEYEKLKKSLTSFTKMLEIRPIAYDEQGVVWGGNMRYQALKQLVSEGVVELKPEYFKLLENYSEADKKEFAIRDNVEYGSWDYAILKNEWKDMPVSDWGLDFKDYDFKPTLEPTIDLSPVTPEHIQKMTEQLENQIKNNEVAQDLVCPNCGHEFKVRL